MDGEDQQPAKHTYQWARNMAIGSKSLRTSHGLQKQVWVHTFVSQHEIKILFVFDGLCLWWALLWLLWSLWWSSSMGQWRDRFWCLLLWFPSLLVGRSEAKTWAVCQSYLTETGLSEELSVHGSAMQVIEACGTATSVCWIYGTV